MKTFYHDKVTLNSGYLYEKQCLNENTTINAVYDRFYDTGRITAFDFAYKEGDEIKPHVFWDSDVAKWMEGAAYIIGKTHDPALEEKVDALVEKIRKNQGEDGYFNIYFTVVEPDGRFTNRDKHELYCAGHLMEAAVAYAEATGKTTFLECMEKYADYINKVFIEDRSAAFTTPGHEEIELALVRMYRHTKNKKYLDMAKFFIDERGKRFEPYPGTNKYKLSDFECSKYNQGHMPVREQTEAVGHAVRALYLYTGMALLASETNDEELIKACKTLWNDVTEKKMYVTGALGSTHIGEAFTSAYDLPNDTAYAETCASIALLFFGRAMQNIETDSKYADAIERALYNGVLSGLSYDGKAFFYENPLEINLKEKFINPWGKRISAITQRVECFSCSCCPPNLARLLPSLGDYVFGMDKDTLYVHQFVSSTLNDANIKCEVTTDYPRNGSVGIKAEGVKRVAVRIPFWCKSFNVNKPYVMDKGYAIIDNDNTAIEVDFDMTPTAVFTGTNVFRDTGKLCIMRGPVVYCAEAVDGQDDLHSYYISPNFASTVKDGAFGLPELTVDALKLVSKDQTSIYSFNVPVKEKTSIDLIPYNAFANRGEADMMVWFNCEF